MLILSTNVDQKSLEIEFSIAICRPNGDKWQFENTVSSGFDPRLSLVKSVYNCRLASVIHLQLSYVDAPSAPE